MRKYECKSCGREVVAPHSADEVDMVCCKGETPVKFKAVDSKVVVPVTKLPTTLPPAAGVKLPPSTPAK